MYAYTNQDPSDVNVYLPMLFLRGGAFANTNNTKIHRSIGVDLCFLVAKHRSTPFLREGWSKSSGSVCGSGETQSHATCSRFL